MTVAEPRLRVDRAYSANDAALILGMPVRSFNEKVREGWIEPIDLKGTRRYSGYELAKRLRWPVSDDPRDYMPNAKARPAMTYPGVGGS